MSLSRLDTRVAQLEARRARAPSPSGLAIVWRADGDTRATALQKAGLAPAEVTGKVIIFVEYEETRPDALPSRLTPGPAGSAAPSCG